MTSAPPMEDLQPATAEALFAERVRALVADRCGYAPRPASMAPLAAALVRRRRGRSHEDYWDALQGAAPGGGELQLLVEDVLNHDTVCGRIPPHFETLGRHVLPALARLGRPLRLASLGCSTGEEVYTMAITAAEIFGLNGSPAVEIVGLDLSARVLEVARAGIYQSSSLRELSPAQRQCGFIRQADGFHVRPEIAQRVRFLQHNIMQPLPLVGLDAVFCRNVLIYFNPDSAQQVLGHIRAALAPGGWLFLGPSESALHLREWFEPAAFAETMLYRRRQL
ncbi:MAG: protein-glutamate O-methyltransferase CheR [Opitutaceae bacterium]|nr:protein-glutamate O-methyltransferase CheR [Opitutaceae bacterium]